MTDLSYKRYSFTTGFSPLKIITDKFNFPQDSQDNFIIPASDILVKIHYASLNPVDSKLHHTSFFQPFSNHGMGKDFSGEVIAVGGNITKFKIGDLVQGFHPGVLTNDGTFSEYLLVKTNMWFLNTEITKIPSNITLKEAAAWPLVLGTAMLMIDGLSIKDKKVLLLGGATSVGRYVTQLLRIEGAEEIVVSCSPRSQELVSELGATRIINYRENVLNQVLDNVRDKPFDYIFDCWGGTELFSNLDTILAKKGTYHTIVGDIPGSDFGSFVSIVQVGLIGLKSTLLMDK
ncbi:hypothetical protein G210_1677 [Candida maltosa Xu316]|uniref:Enoyl reductase (ER) domain-containing protein n=1 Tax=Candida maltosa (strain Xu316) TaxID=1245528 RepID=M3HSX4_CANMX|nr:hypothetical protein G210_1677 [Candida maltosa Xu316]